MNVEPTWLISKRGIVVYANDSAERFFEQAFQKDIFVESIFLESITHAAREFWKEQIDRAFRLGNNAFIYKTITPELKQFIVKCGTHFYDGTDCVRFHAVDLTDFKFPNTENEDVQEAYLKSRQEIDELIYRLSHQIRGPLTSSLGLLNVARIDNVESRFKYFDLLQDRIEKLDATILDIETIVRNIRVEPLIEEVNLQQVIDSVLDKLKVKEINSLTLNQHVMQQQKVYSDAGSIHTVLYHLVDNALKYMDVNKNDSFLNINLATDQEQLYIIVEDNGEGIEPEIKTHIFDMFFRGSAEGRGAGLGLYICREIIHRLDGRVFVHSEKGKGTIFTASLPNNI